MNKPANMLTNSIRLINWNAHSVINKKTDIEAMISSIQLQVFCITETWLGPAIPFNIYGYNIYRKDRERGRGGGVLIGVVRNVVTSALDIIVTDRSDILGM